MMMTAVVCVYLAATCRRDIGSTSSLASGRPMPLRVTRGTFARRRGARRDIRRDERRDTHCDYARRCAAWRGSHRDRTEIAPRSHRDRTEIAPRPARWGHVCVRHRWRGWLIDSSYSNRSINLTRAKLTPANVPGTFDALGVPRGGLDLLSVDVDCHDLWLTRAILRVRSHLALATWHLPYPSTWHMFHAPWWCRLASVHVSSSTRSMTAY